jgi:hypothetical protein
VQSVPYDPQVPWRKRRIADPIPRRLTLGKYRELLADVPTPTREQLEAFARFVSTAHSWYKHLPLLPPGAPMTFFLDPGAGAQLIVDRRGRIRQVNRRKHGFHYSWRPTAEYRERFGHAAFARGAGTGTLVSLIRADRTQLVPSDVEPAIFVEDRAALVALPDEVLEAGVAYLSGIVHPRASFPPLWRRRRNLDDATRVDWPAESGGAAGLQRILDRVQALAAAPNLIEPPPEPPPDDRGWLQSCDFALYRLLTPERERQQRAIVTALEQVIDLVR